MKPLLLSFLLPMQGLSYYPLVSDTFRLEFGRCSRLAASPDVETSLQHPPLTPSEAVYSRRRQDTKAGTQAALDQISIRSRRIVCRISAGQEIGPSELA